MDPTRIPLEQYAGNVQALAMFAVFAGYRPANAIGALGFVPPFALGVNAYSALAVLEGRIGELQTRNAGLISDAEGKATPDEVLAALQASADERDRNSAELQKLVPQAAAEKARREATRAAAPLPNGDDIQAASGAVLIPADARITPGSAPSKAPTPFTNFRDYLMAVRQSAINLQQGIAPDARVSAIQQWAAATGMGEVVGSDGGFLLQQDISNDFDKKIQTQAILWPATTPVPLSDGSVGTKINLIDETSRATGSRWGGVQVYWRAEAASVTGTKKPKIFPLELNLTELIGIAYQTGELGQDSTASAALLESAFTDEIAFVLDDSVLRGPGAGQPKGILSSDALISVSAESGQAADTVISENIIKMFARMPGRNLRNATWYINQELWPQIFQLQLVIGTGGVPMFIPTSGLGDAPGGTLLGRPIQTLEQCSAPGDVGDILFADISQYLRLAPGGERSGIQRASSIHVNFLVNENVFRWILRTNGAPGWKSAVTPYKGSNTISPFVALAAR